MSISQDIRGMHTPEQSMRSVVLKAMIRRPSKIEQQWPLRVIERVGTVLKLFGMSDIWFVICINSECALVVVSVRW